MIYPTNNTSENGDDTWEKIVSPTPPNRVYYYNSVDRTSTWLVPPSHSDHPDYPERLIRMQRRNEQQALRLQRIESESRNRGSRWGMTEIILHPQVTGRCFVRFPNCTWVAVSMLVLSFTLLWFPSTIEFVARFPFFSVS